MLLLQAAAWLIWIRLLLFVFPFRYVKTLVHRWSKPHGVRFPTHRLAYLINAAANCLPRTNCLPRALVAQVLLCRHGHPAELHIGVTKEPNGKFEAHAWVESAGQVVIGGSAVGRYRRLFSGTTEPPEGPSKGGTNRLKDPGSKGPSRPLVPSA